MSTTPQRRRKTLECPGCAKSYTSIMTLQEHIKRIHPHVRDELYNIVKAGQWKCVQFPCVMGGSCFEVCKSRNQLLKHLANLHNVAVDWVEDHFASVQDFESYRVSLRAKGHFFIKCTSRSKGRSANEFPFVLYRCNREGNRFQKKNRPPTTDNRSTIKIGTFCTAYLKIFMKPEGIHCIGSLTHCNHGINYKVREVDGGIAARVKVVDENPEPAENEYPREVEEGMVEEIHDVGEVIEGPQIVETATGSQGTVLIVTQEDSEAHEKLNSLVEESIWKLQEIQEERCTQRLIFYADALQQLVKSSQEMISGTLMAHLQKNKARQNLAHIKIQQT